MSTLYSHSRLACFEKCKKQFHFRYVLQIPVESEGIEAFVGKRVHEVLERLYRFVDRDQIPSLERVLYRYNVLFDEQYDEKRVRIVREGMLCSDYRQLGVDCLTHYYRSHYPFDGDQTLGLEKHVVFALDDAGRYRIQGFVDRISRAHDGAIEIHDYKTGRWVPKQSALDTDRQLALYQIGLSDEIDPDRPVRLVWHYLARRRRCTSTRTPKQLESLARATIELIDRVEEERAFPTRRSNLCSWCEYQEICPALNASRDEDEKAESSSSAAPEALATD